MMMVRYIYLITLDNIAQYWILTLTQPSILRRPIKGKRKRWTSNSVHFRHGHDHLHDISFYVYQLQKLANLCYYPMNTKWASAETKRKHQCTRCVLSRPLWSSTINCRPRCWCGYIVQVGTAHHWSNIKYNLLPYHCLLNTQGHGHALINEYFARKSTTRCKFGRAMVQDSINWGSDKNIWLARMEH